eukprot:797093-Pyramimonas_sp.AAC.1
MVYNNSGSRLILPYNLLEHRALARDFLTTYTGIALSRGTSSSGEGAEPNGHSLSLGAWLK